MHWLLLPLVAAGIGWFTNFIAVRMIFRPRQPRGIGPLRFQGTQQGNRRDTRNAAVIVEVSLDI